MFTDCGAGSLSYASGSSGGGGTSVKTFGARGDGTSDDTAALQRAIDSIRTTGGALYIPAGVYRFTNLDMTRINSGFSTTFTITGDGPLSSILRQTTGATGNAIDMSGSNFCHFEGWGLEPGPNSAVGILAARLVGAQNCNFNTYVRFWIRGSTTKACFVGVGNECMTIDRCFFDTGGQTVFFSGVRNTLSATSAFGTILEGLSNTANHVFNTRFSSSLTSPLIYLSEGTGIDFVTCETYATGANVFSSHVYFDVPVTNQFGWATKFDKCHFEGNGDVFRFANSANSPTKAVYENIHITNNVCINSGYKWVVQGGADIVHIGFVFENNVGGFPVELRDVERSSIHHVEVGATIVIAGANNMCTIRGLHAGVTLAGNLCSQVILMSDFATVGRSFAQYGNALGTAGTYVRYVPASTAPAAGQISDGMIASAQPPGWDPCAVGGTSSYPVYYNGTVWKKMYS